MIGERIKQRRRELGMSQDEFAWFFTRYTHFTPKKKTAG